VLDYSLITPSRGSFQLILPHMVPPLRQVPAAISTLFPMIGREALLIILMQTNLPTENTRLGGILHPTVPLPRFRDQGVRVQSLINWMH